MPAPLLNPARVTALHAAMVGHVERGDIAGAVALIARGDEVDVSAVGTKLLGGGEPIRRDTIFRIASMTKPITAAAAMIMVDDGVIRLEDPIERWLPELANRQVLRSIGSALDDTVPAGRAITVRDLQVSCFGFGSVMARPGTHPIQGAISEGHLGGDGHHNPLYMPAPDEWLRRLGALPLMYQPGARWAYHTASDVIGVLVSRASRQSFGAFLSERIFDPLGMIDTGFSVPPSRMNRLPDCYQFNPERRALEIFDSAAESAYRQAPAFESGAGGLVSTVDDYHAFCRMMLNRGVVAGRRILTEESVAAMTRDQLTPDQRQGSEIFLGDDSSWGYGMSVNIRKSRPWVVPGRFGWDGSFGTSAYSDPANNFIGILLTQRLLGGPEPPTVFDDFWEKAYRTVTP